MIAQDTLLVMLVKLADQIAVPPPPAKRHRGHPRVYSDRLFLKALVIMILRHLHKVHELLMVLQEPTPQMQALRALLTEHGRYPSRRTWERRLKAIPDTLPAQIGCLGRALVALIQPWARCGRAAAILVWLLVTRGSYRRVERVLLALCMIALGYVASKPLARPSWEEVLRQTVPPSFQTDRDYPLLLLAMIGTTVAPRMLYYLQASVVDKGSTAADYRPVRLDVVNGVIWGNVISCFIVICTRGTLFRHGIAVQTPEQAAMALVPWPAAGLRRSSR